MKERKKKKRGDEEGGRGEIKWLGRRWRRRRKERKKKRRASRRKERGRRGRKRERKRDADGIISNAPQHVAPVSPPPGCQTCFFLCAIVSKAKVQRERGCRAYHEILSTDSSLRPRNRRLAYTPFVTSRRREIAGSKRSRGPPAPGFASGLSVWFPGSLATRRRYLVKSEIHCRNTRRSK